MGKRKSLDGTTYQRILPTIRFKSLKPYYRAFKKKRWAYTQAVRHYRKWKILGNSLSLAFASGGIASAVATGGEALVAVSTTSMLIQGFMMHKDLDMKIQNSRYAY